VRHFKDPWGITFQTLEPFNEPMGDWWNVNGGQEGCSFSRANQAKMLKELSGRLSEMKLTTRIAASDEAGYDEAVATYNAFDSTTRSLIRQINTHGYSGSKRADLRKLADRDRKKLWASEIDGSGAPAPFDKWTHNHNDIAPGLDIANRVIRDIRDLQPDGWIFWQAVESEQAQISLDKNWGCIHADFTGGERFYICKKFHALRQFTRFIRPGSTLIGCTENEAVAFISPAKDRLVIVQRNGATSPVSNTYTLGEGILPASAASAAVWRTSADENFAHLEDIHLSGSAFTASLKAQSITSFVIPLNCGTATENSSLSRSRTFPLNASIDSKGNLVIRNGSEVSVSVEFFSMSGKRVLKAAAPPGVIRFNRRLIGTGSAMILRTSESSFHAHSSASKGAACAGLFLPTLTPRE
jgi:O-glycosyl hydrolase